MRAMKTDLPVAMEMPGFSSRQTEWGDLNVAFEAISGGMDATDMFVKLPDGRCQCPHWGYVLSGRLTFRYADREEVFEAGDAFYTPPGHAPVKHEPGSEIVMFSPAEELKKTDAVMMKNMQAMQSA